MNTKDLIQLEDRYSAHNYHPLDVVITRGEGVWVVDTDGNRYLDCLSAYSALSHGHVHPRILKAARDQMENLTLTSRAFRNDQFPQLVKEISEITGYQSSLFMNSGAEAVETAIKIARKWAYVIKGIRRHQAEIIVAEGNFHGRTITTVSCSTVHQYRDDFGPFTPGFIVVPYGDINAIRKAITPNTAAVILEPIQGEAGIRIPPPGYIREVSEICSKEKVLFIADEIQTGLGRTGKFFACEHDGIWPDMIILGKALGGGFYPVSCVIADNPVMEIIQPGDHGSTFGGNPLAAAVAREALKVITEEGLVENSAVLGDYLLVKLKEMASPHVKEIRGKGLFIGIELKPESRGARRFCESLMKEGILAKETHYHVIRLAPPLIIDQQTIDWMLPKINKVLAMP